MTTPLTQGTSRAAGNIPAQAKHLDISPPPSAAVSDANSTPTSSNSPQMTSSSSARRNSVNRASSLSSATVPHTKSNFLAVPEPSMGAGARRGSIERARSLGNEDATDTRLATSHCCSSCRSRIHCTSCVVVVVVTASYFLRSPLF